ncbi:MAG: hypothetical protein U0R72_05465 [Nakamurella multipartita]
MSIQLAALAAKTAAVAGMAAAAAVMVAPLASAATPSATSAAAPAAAHKVGDFTSEGVVLTNLTPFALTEQSASAPGGWGDNGQPNESTVSPGYASTWWVAFTPNSPFTVDYTFTDSQGNVQTVHATEADTQDATPACSVTGTDSADWQCDVSATSGENNFALNLHAAQAAVNVSPAVADQFAQALNNICSTEGGANGLATCRFEPDSTAPVYSESTTGFVPAGANTIFGCKPWGASFQYTGSGTQSQTASTGGSDSVTLSTSVFGVANAGFTHQNTWGQAYTTGKSYSDKQTVHAAYGYVATPFWYPTIGTASGSFTATLGGTTYTFAHVTIHDSGVAGVDANGDALGQASMSTNTYRMTKAQWAQNCGGDTPPAWLN